MAGGASLTFQIAGEPQQTLRLDAVLSQPHELVAEATDHPVEKGANPTDHVHVKPETLTVEAIVSDYALSSDAADILQAGKRTSDALALLDRIRSTGTLVRYVSPRRSVDNLLITRLSWPYEAKSGSTLKVTIGMKQVRIVETASVAIKKQARRTSETKDAPEKNEGQKPTQPWLEGSVAWQAFVPDSSKKEDWERRNGRASQKKLQTLTGGSR